MYCAPGKTSHRLSLPQAASCSCSCGLGDHFNIVEGDEDVFENSAGNKFNRSFFFCDLCFLNSLRFEICTAKLIFWSFVLDSSTKLTTFNLNDIFVKLTLYDGDDCIYSDGHPKLTALFTKQLLDLERCKHKEQL